MTSRRTRDRMVNRLREQGIQHPEVLELMAKLPRHLFLDEALAHRAYEDTALPIGYSQTLSQPYIVARMTELLLNHCQRLDRVLEIGTGSGYQTVILSQLCKKVWSVERIRALQDKARARTQSFKIYNIQFKHADGGLGLPDYAPYDAILSAAAPALVPDDLKAQLAADGVLVIPVGVEQQELTVIKRKGDTDEFEQHIIEPVRFVPLLSGITR